MQKYNKVFQLGNRKLPKTTAIFNLPAQKTCPGKTEYCTKICYAMKAERIYPQTRPFRERNLAFTKDVNFVTQVVAEINKRSVNATNRISKIDTVRIHESGDFYSQDYFNKWVSIAKICPTITFYAYTKTHWLDLSSKPSNMIIKLSLDDTSSTDAFLASTKFDGIAFTMQPNAIPEDATFVCPGSCKTCDYCWTTKGDLAFNKH